MNNSLKLLIIFLLAGVVAPAQETLQISLSEAQDYAIEHNKSLKNAKLDIQVSDLKYKEAVASGLPQIEAGIDYTTYFGYEMQIDFSMGSDFSSVTEADMQKAMDETLVLFPGVTPMDIYKYNAGSTYTGKLSDLMPKAGIKMTDQSTGKIQIGQLIYNGQFWVGLQTAKLGKKIAEQGFESSVLDIKENVASSYFMALVTQRSLSIVDKNIENLKKIKGHTQKMYETGILELTDLDQISMQVVMLENSKRSIERSLNMIYNLLKFQLGLSADSKIVLSETLDQLMPVRINGDFDSENFNIENNILFQMTETSEKISEQMVKMEKMAYLPTLTGYYAYNQKFLTTGFDMTPNHIAGASLSIPVFSSGARKHKLAQAKIQLEQSRINSSMVSDQLKMQEEQMRFEIKSAIENYESQKENVEVAKRSFDNINRKYDQGMVSSLDLTQANSNYLQAEANYFQAILSLVQAQLKLEKLYNKL